MNNRADLLNQFSRHYEWSLIKYISSTIKFSAIDYYRKKRRDEKFISFPISSDTENLLLDQSCLSDNFLGDGFLENDDVYKALSRLTERQKTILYQYYFEGFNDTEIAKHLKVSQQSVSKSRASALKKMRGMIEHGRD